MLQLMYDVHTCDHAMCLNFHCSLWNTFATSFQLWLQLIELLGPLMRHYWTTNVQICCDYGASTYNSIKIQIHM
jgi:hypothetical protein